MSDRRPSWSRRRLLQYGGIGAALAIAGCSTSDDSDEENDDPDENENDDGGDGGENNDDNGDENGGTTVNDELPDSPEEAFTLAGDGAVDFREWLVPELTIQTADDGDRKSLYQFNNFELSADHGISGMQTRRQEIAAGIGVEPASIERELLLGPLSDEIPYSIFFGDFDTDAVEQAVRSQGREKTGEDGEFVIFDDLLAVSDGTIMEHPEYSAIIETSRGERSRFGEINDDMELLLDLVPAGPQVTLNSRDDHDDLVLDAMTIFELEGPVVTSAIRTLIFDDASAATIERVEELAIENSNMNERTTLEIYGRVAMVETRYEGE